MSDTNPKIDAYLKRIKQWQNESARLREIALSCALDEDLKWGKPCYSFEGGNVVIIQGFKAYCALLFFKGVLMKDPEGILQKTGENTIVGRQIRFTSVEQITKQKSVLKAYIQQAIDVEKSGLKLEQKEKPEIELPAELQSKFKQMPALKRAFESLTPGRQRAYIFFFTSARQSATRVSRIEKYTKQILSGKGMMD